MAALPGLDKSSLQKSLSDILVLENALEAGPQKAEAGGQEKGKGLFDSLMDFFGIKKR